MAIVPEHVWLEVIPIQREFNLSGRQVAELIAKRYKLFISRQAVNSKLETMRHWQPRKLD